MIICSKSNKNSAKERQMHKIRSVFVKTKNKYMDARIGAKIMLLFSIIMIFTISISSLIYNEIYSNIMFRKISETSIQSLDSIGSIITSTFENENRFSKIIIANNEIQNALTNATEYNGDNYSRSINIYLAGILDNNSLASSVYIIDNYGNNYGADKGGLKSVKIKGRSLNDFQWYNEAKEKKGSYVLRHNGGGVFGEISSEGFVSMIRIINNIQTFEPIGILAVNIPEKSIGLSYRSIIDKYGTSVMVIDNMGVSVSNLISEKLLGSESDMYGILAEKTESKLVRVKNKEYIFSKLKVTGIDWSIIGATPFDEFSKESSVFSIVTFLVIVINGILFLFGAIFISRLITGPIKKLLDSMKSVEQGEFKKAEIAAGKDEVGLLKDRYNIMVEEIQKLFQKTIEDQKLKRKAELNMLQAQIKPHFLYNTLDSISSLAISGKNKKVYFVVKSLGSFYRTSLSKGKEVITIGEEIKSVQNYLRIQKVRYGKMFKAVYDIDERTLKFRTLKLILQPLVENSLYHGIRPRGANGSIRISAKYLDGFIELVVEDNGVGMSRQKLDQVCGRIKDPDKASFGLLGTLERLRIFYGMEDIWTIESIENSGTKITITIPAFEGEF